MQSNGGAAQVSVTVGANWPQLGGPDITRDGLNPFENILDPVTVRSLRTVATANTGSTIRSSPAVVGDTTYVGADNGVLYAFSGCASGHCRTLWRGATGGGIGSSPAYTNGTIVVASEDGNLYAFPASCGTSGGACQPRWTAAIGRSDSSPLVADNRIFIGSSNGNVYAFPAAGCGTAVCQPMWTANVGGYVPGGPAYAANMVFVGSSSGQLEALDASTGATIWTAGTAGSIVGSPALGRTDVFVGTTTGTLYAFRTGCATGGRSCAPAWSAHANAPIDSTPALAYDQVIVGTTAGGLYSWSTLPCDTPPRAPAYTATLDGAILGSPAVANGVAYATTKAGSLYALDAKRLGVLSHLAVGATQSSLAVANGDVYVADSAGTLDVLGDGPTAPTSTRPPAASLRPLGTPIRHIVVLYQENHSFDNVLGALCVEHQRCDGTVTGLTAAGVRLLLSRATDNPPTMNHNVADQLTAIDGGKMDGFSNMSMCTAATGYACYTQYLPTQIPNLAALALRFTISDRTFELNASASFGSHLELASGGLDGFLGDNPGGFPSVQRPGWGCDSNVIAKWVNSAGVMSRQPSCVPWPDGSGAFKRTPVQWVPTIMDHLDSAGYTWNIYEGGAYPKARVNGYIWAICPTLADCLYSQQANALRPSPSVIADAASGSLPSLSFVQPASPDSQHAPTP